MCRGFFRLSIALMKRVHFIAIGGAAMHSLALALKGAGYEISGSDDEINEPSKSRLKAAGLLPEKIGWHAEHIHPGIDVVILGMHARKDNPELLRAQALGIRVMSYPEFVYEATKNKLRVVIGGSHGKTSITSMILHILKKSGKKFDYLAGAQIRVFDNMVGISNDSEIAVIEGDEYLASPIDPRPKFHLYHPHIGVISGIAWDHINVFPTFSSYVEQFKIFTECISKDGSLIYSEEDAEVVKIAEKSPGAIHKIPYRAYASEINDGITSLIHDGKKYPIRVFGKHNLQNISAAFEVCKQLGLTEQNCLTSIGDFEGAARRLEKIYDNKGRTVFRDFAHSPSKLKATIEAVKKQFIGRPLIACMELHTFSSLNKHFLSEYKGCMEMADKAVVYFNPKTIAHKKLPPVDATEVYAAFGSEKLTVTDNSPAFSALVKEILAESTHPVLLLMSSGTYDGVNLEALYKED